MKVIIARNLLVELIGIIQGVIPLKAPIPILSNLLIEASEGKLIMSGTDLTISIRSQISCQVIKEGAITLPARRFFQLIREMTTLDIEIEANTDDIAHIKSAAAEFRIHGIHKSEFPSFPDLSRGLSFTIDSSTFKEMLSKSTFAAAREDSRHVLNSIFMHLENNMATFIGTDGKRLAKINTPISWDKDQTAKSYLIPLKACEEMIKLSQGNISISLYLLPDKIGMKVDSTWLITNLLSGEYPDVQRIIPTQTEKKLALHREELMSLLKQIALFTSEKNHSVHFNFKKGELILTANNAELGHGKVSMSVDYFEEPFEVAFNPFFFHDILRHSKDEIVYFSLTNAYNPGLITDSTTANFVIMPMRLNHV